MKSVTTTKETFTSFYGDTNPNTTGLTISTYENPVDKLYDNDFYDPKTGNVLRVTADMYDSSKGPDNTGTTIKTIDLIDRTGHTTTYGKNEKIIINGLTSVPYNYTAWSAFSLNDASTHITSNQLIYSCWGQDTYIHIIDFDNNLNACGYYYSPSLKSPIYTNYNMSMPRIEVTKRDNNSSNNTYIFNNIVNMPLYQFTTNIFYSPLTSDVMIIDGKGKYLLYNRYGNSTPKFTDTGIDVSTKPWFEYDLVGNHMMIYVPYKKNTMIIILKLNTDGSTYSVISVGRFLEDGSLQKDANTNISIPQDVLSASKSATTPSSTPTSAPVSSSASTSTSSAPSSSDHSTKSGSNTDFSMQQMNDYLLKTQIIPPICPVCPVCPSTTTCTNCGAAPTSAPVAAPSSSKDQHSAWSSTPSGFYQDLKHAGSETKELIEDTAGGTVDLAKEAVGGTVGLAKEAAGGTVKLAKETVGGAVGLGKEAVGGTVGLAKETVGGAVGLVKEAGQGTVDLLRGAGKGISGLFKEDGTNIGGQSIASYDPSTGGIASGPVGYYAEGVKGPQNPFTYNGALTEKPSSDFIPITADFSKFGR